MVVRIVILLTFLSSCTPENRLNRLISKHPHLVKSDTIWKTDTTIIQAVRYDTSFTLSYDTTTIVHDRLTIKHFFNRHDSTVYISGECAGDTIYKEIPTVINTVISEKPFNWYLFLLVGVILLIIIDRLRTSQKYTH
jgi:hypothetical protein